MKSRIHAIGWLLGAMTCFFMVHCPQARGHEDLLEQIREITAQLEKNPGNPELYLKRGQIHRLHHSLDEALADFELADSLSNQWQVLQFERAQVFLDAGWLTSANAAADRFLASHPNHTDALVLRARVRTKLGNRLGAAQDYSRAIANSPNPAPELYVERAQTLASEGGEHLSEALRGLDQGMAKLGPLVTLQLAAIEVELKQNRIDAALTRIDQAMALVPRKESWLVRRAEILQRAGRTQAAAENFKAAWAALDSLPPARRNAPAMAELDQRIRAGLAAVQK